MDCTVVKCKDCGTIMVVNTNELWKLNRCTKCGSENISTIDEDFDFAMFSPPFAKIFSYP
jgi:predicted Zn-ribbon and HTH transcriptional regulator